MCRHQQHSIYYNKRICRIRASGRLRDDKSHSVSYVSNTTKIGLLSGYSDFFFFFCYMVFRNNRDEPNPQKPLLKGFFYAGGGTRTPTPRKAADFESAASTDSATPAGSLILFCFQAVCVGCLFPPLSISFFRVCRLFPLFGHVF